MSTINSLKKIVICKVIENTVDICKDERNNLLITNEFREYDEVDSEEENEEQEEDRKAFISYEFHLKWEAEISKVLCK